MEGKEKMVEGDQEEDQTQEKDLEKGDIWECILTKMNGPLLGMNSKSQSHWEKKV